MSEPGPGGGRETTPLVSDLFLNDHILAEGPRSFPDETGVTQVTHIAHVHHAHVVVRTVVIHL